MYFNRTRPLSLRVNKFDKSIDFSYTTYTNKLGSQHLLVSTSSNVPPERGYEKVFNACPGVSNSFFFFRAVFKFGQCVHFGLRRKMLNPPIARLPAI